jgi:orotate phosphoribosyltransferase-like protein
MDMKQEKNPTIDIKKYGGKQVAIVDGKVIASGKTLSEVIKKARKIEPARPLHEIAVFSVPKTLHVIYHA